MRQACLPVCGQSLHAAVELSDSLLPGLSWLSFCSCHLCVYEKGADAAVSSVALLCGSGVGSRRWCRRSRHRTPVTRHQPHLLARWSMDHVAFCLYSKLDIVAICAMHDAHPLDLLGGKASIFCDGLPTRRSRLMQQPSGEPDMLAVGF